MAACGVISDFYGQRWLGLVYLPRDQPTLLRILDRLYDGVHMYFTRFEFEQNKQTVCLHEQQP